MNLVRALRLTPSTLAGISHKSAQNNMGAVGFVGAGGKTTAIFQLAHEIANYKSAIHAPYARACIVTSTTHLGAWQTSFADHHIIANHLDDLKNLPVHGVTLITGEIESNRTKPISENILNWLRENSTTSNIPLFIEADGSRQKPLKAPATHEPPIPEFTETAIVVAGLTALGKPLTDEFVHRAEIFSQLSGLQINHPITTDAIIRMLTHSQGGLKNIPLHARRVAFLNQADTPELQSLGGDMARKLLNQFDAVMVGTLQQNNLQTFEHCAGIILAAGESTRFGSPKQLLDWKGKPFVRQVAETALQAGLWPVEVITGFHAADIESALSGLPVNIVYNPDYQQGQSTSIKAGITSLNSSDLRGSVGAAIFLLADQPQIPVEVIRALVESHTQEMHSILAPLVLEERRANPVLFDRVTFPNLLNLTGDVGGRAIFDKHRVEYLPWHDDILLFDVDKPEDYQRMKEME